MDKKDIGKKTKIGIVYNSLARLASTFGQFISTIVLARLLAPEDFGLVATGMLVIGFATKFGEFGFHMGLIQRKEEITAKHIDTLFVMDFAFKLVLWLIIYIFTPNLATYFNDPRLLTALPVIAFYMLAECFSTTPLTVLKRNMDFKSTSMISTAERYTGITLSIVFAALGFGYWSLIYSKIIGVLLSGLLASIKTRWYPKPRYDHQASKELFRFGIMISLRNLFRYGADNVDYFFVTKVLGSRELGFYEKAFRLMRLPQRRISRAVNRVVFSAFARIQDEPERIRRAFRKLILAISLVSYPVLLMMAFVAPLFIPLVLGEKWRPSVLPLQIMCIAGLLRSMDPFLNSLLTATGFVKSTVTRRAFEFGLLTLAAFLGVKHGIVGVSIAVVLAAIVVLFLMLSIITRVTRVQWKDYFGPQVPAIIATAGMFAAMYFSSKLLALHIRPDGFFMLGAQMGIGAVSYIAMHVLLRFPSVVELVQELAGDTQGVVARVKKKMRRKSKKIPAAPVAKSETQ